MHHIFQEITVSILKTPTGPSLGLISTKTTHSFFILFIFYAERLSSLRGCRFLCTVITNDKCRP